MRPRHENTPETHYQAEANTPAWLSSPHGHPVWTRRPASPTAKGTSPTGTGVIHRAGTMHGLPPLRTAEIRAVGSRGESVAYDGLRLARLANQRCTNRLALRVRGAGHVLTAVRRNRCRRQLCALYRRHSETLPQGYDLLLIARCPSTPPTFQNLEAAWKGLCAVWRQRAASRSSY